jgi:hypothetical protein
MKSLLMIAALMVGCSADGTGPVSGPTAPDAGVEPVHPSSDAAAMTPDASNPTMDPTGTWDLRFSWTAGTCGLTLAATAKMVIAHSPGGYTIADASPTTQVSGTVTCGENFCHLSFTEVGPGRGANTKSATVTGELDVTRDGAINGTGSLTFLFTDGTGCSQTFIATGRLQ